MDGHRRIQAARTHHRGNGSLAGNQPHLPLVVYQNRLSHDVQRMDCRAAHLLCQAAVGEASRADAGSHLRGIRFSFAQSFHKDIHEESRLPTIQVAKTVHYEQLSQLALSTILCAFRKPHLCPNVNYLLYNQNKRINNHIIIIKSYFFISLS